MAKRRRQQRLDMVRSHEVMAVEGRKGAGRQHQEHLRAGACAKGDLGSGARGRRQVDDIAPDLFVQHHRRNLRPARVDVRRPQRRLDAGLHGIAELDARLPPAQDLHLVGRRRVVETHLEEEAVLLGLGQRIRALVLDRVLRGHDEKRSRQRQLLSLERHPALLHRFEQG